MLLRSNWLWFVAAVGVFAVPGFGVAQKAEAAGTITSEVAIDDNLYPAFSGGGTSGEPPLAEPTGVTGPGGYCPNYVTGSASAHAPEREFTTYETTGEARGPHVWTASVAAYGYDCMDGTSRVFVDMDWDTTPLFSTPITAQYQVHRDTGSGAAGVVFDIEPHTTRQCCWEVADLPRLDLGSSGGLLDTFVKAARKVTP